MENNNEMKDAEDATSNKRSAEDILRFIVRNYGRKLGAPSIEEEFAQCFAERFRYVEGTAENRYYRFGTAIAYADVIAWIQHLQPEVPGYGQPETGHGMSTGVGEGG